MKMLYEREFKERDIMSLYKCIDWLLRLPEDLEIKLLDRVTTLERKNIMPYITFAERNGMKKGEAIGEARGEARGEANGLREAIALCLKLRFGLEGLKLLPRIRGVEEAKALRSLLTAVHKAKTLAAFREKLPRA